MMYNILLQLYLPAAWWACFAGLHYIQVLLTQVHLLQCLPTLWAVMLEQFLRAVTPCEGYYSMLEQQARHATAIPSRKYPFSSDQGSHTGLGSTSTRLSDRPGTLSAVVFMHKPHNGAKQPVLLPILFLPSYLLPFHLQLACPSMQTQSVWLHCAWLATVFDPA